MSDKFFEEEEKEEKIDTRIDSDDNEAVQEIMKRTQMSNEMPIYIEDEIKASYLDYSMSVIVSRALPDVRDGLKPVHRRILFAMNELGMSNDKPYKKSARIVGEVLGKYHPHGDSAVYNAMVRLAQDFNTRYLLVDGHGNFGSVDGDSAAAMRYTEARMAKITEELLVDIDKNTIDFRKNFDESLDEPVVLPAKLPNLLLNGTTGIAVGMATNIPPHNLRELVDAIIMLIENKDVSVLDLMSCVKGPDFPTGGIIYGKEGIKSAYETGKGKIKVSSKTEIEKYKNGKEAIIITELPYQVNKARLIEKIAELVKNKKITGISELRDETDRDGTRIVIELKKGEESELVLNNLFKFTDLQVTYGIIMLALVKNVPRILNLKEILSKYLEHRIEVITRKTKFELDKANRRLHILEGFRKALDHIDEIIKLIRASKDTQEAKEALITRFEFSDLQARAILDMKLQRLTGLERDKIENEYENIVKYIKDLEEILASEDRKNSIIIEQLKELKEKYGDERRTSIENDRDEITYEDLIKNEEVVVTITHKGYVKRISLDAYKSQKRGGIGVSATKPIEDDLLKNIYTVKTLDKILVFTDKGRVYETKVYQIPEASKQSRGKLIQNIIKLEENEKVSVIMPVDKREEDDRELLFVTKLGMAKKTKISEYNTINSNGKRAITFKENDELKFVGITSGTGQDQVYIATKYGKAIRFKETDIRASGRSSMGVKAIKLVNDEVVAADIIYSFLKEEDLTVLTFNSLGYGKRTPLSEYGIIKRGGKGVMNYKLEGKNNFVVYSSMIQSTDEHEVAILAISSLGNVIRFTVKDLSIIGRNTKGVKIQRLKYDEYLVSADRVIVQEEDEQSEELE